MCNGTRRLARYFRGQRETRAEDFYQARTRMVLPTFMRTEEDRTYDGASEILFRCQEIRQNGQKTKKRISSSEKKHNKKAVNKAFICD